MPLALPIDSKQLSDRVVLLQHPSRKRTLWLLRRVRKVARCAFIDVTIAPGEQAWFPVNGMPPETVVSEVAMRSALDIKAAPGPKARRPAGAKVPRCLMRRKILKDFTVGVVPLDIDLFGTATPGVPLENCGVCGPRCMKRLARKLDSRKGHIFRGKR